MTEEEVKALLASPWQSEWRPYGPCVTPTHPLDELERSLTPDELETVVRWEGFITIRPDSKDMLSARVLAEQGRVIVKPWRDVPELALIAPDGAA